jgi:hypothetical protein
VLDSQLVRDGDTIFSVNHLEPLVAVILDLDTNQDDSGTTQLLPF